MRGQAPLTTTTRHLLYYSRITLRPSARVMLTESTYPPFLCSSISMTTRPLARGSIKSVEIVSLADVSEDYLRVYWWDRELASSASGCRPMRTWLQTKFRDWKSCPWVISISHSCYLNFSNSRIAGDFTPRQPYYLWYRTCWKKTPCQIQ